jgi:pimeloyl-ACP methyl ester carboxylesterase
MSHSLGGLVTQIVQQKLVDQGTSLREAFGVKRAVMLAPALPQEIPSAIGNDPAFIAFLAAFITFDPALGTYLLVPDALFPVVIFSRPDHTLASNAPTPEEVTAHGYNGPESFAAMSQLVGIPPVERPDIDPAIFSHGLGTRLDLVTFENDTLIRPEEGSALYTYLTGDSELSRFTLVEGDDAVHGLPISDPEAVLDAMDETE